MRLILASQSPRRREVLKLMGLDFEVIVSNVEENAPENLSPEKLVCALALQKAQAVYLMHPEDCVIGADTIVFIDEKVIGKPADDMDAKRILNLLQGRTHEVYTGLAVLSSTGRDVQAERTKVVFAPMSQEEIDWYVSTGEPGDKAGAYGVQGLGSLFVEKVEGNYFNVIGMPVPLLYKMLNGAGIKVLNG
ncbi:Maf family protein [Eubacteriales bacterium OttesenSCG-928-K08]|nr:Maf family protein [Eubacteriales bacterium OttesenSCG-928-K08]